MFNIIDVSALCDKKGGDMVKIRNVLLELIQIVLLIPALVVGTLALIFILVLTWFEDKKTDDVKYDSRLEIKDDDPIMYLDG